MHHAKQKCRSREGAWIEIRNWLIVTEATEDVAPVRERGLKCDGAVDSADSGCRSREGAWIEIAANLAFSRATLGRSREGAWIEIRVLR